MAGISLSLVIVFALITAALITSACATASGSNKPDPLTIQEQGSFAVGGTVITAPGTFDPIKQGAYNPAGPDSAGRLLHGDLSPERATTA